MKNKYKDSAGSFFDPSNMNMKVRLILMILVLSFLSCEAQEKIRVIEGDFVIKDTVILPEIIIDSIPYPVEVIIRDTLEIEVIIRDTVKIPDPYPVEVVKETVIDTIIVDGRSVMTDWTNRLNYPADPISYIHAKDIGVIELDLDTVYSWQRRFKLERTLKYEDAVTKYRNLDVPLQLIHVQIFNVTDSSADFSFHLSDINIDEAMISIKKDDESLDWETYMITKLIPVDKDLFTGDSLESDTNYLVQLYVIKGSEEFNSKVFKFKTE